MSELFKSNNTVKLNYKNKIDGIELLRQINDEQISVCFFDPQYRGVLDRLSFGNEKTAKCKTRANLSQMSEDMIITFINEINIITKPSGHLFMWVDKYHLCNGVTNWFINTDFQLVDMIVWDKGKLGLGYRTRRRCEYLIIFQKKHVRAKDIWADHSIPDVWIEKVKKTHPHSKPVELQKRLIQAVIKDGEIVCDPASGGYSVFNACQEIGCDFIGGDIEFGE